jgi:hypothetical protein
MGQDPDAIEREIRDTRERISSRISGVQRRIAGDVENLKRDAEDEANVAIEELKGLFDLGEQTRQHPYTLLTGGMGLGVLLGVASESISLNGNGHQSSNGHNGSNGWGNGSSQSASGLNGLLSGVLSLAATTFQDELKDLMRDGFASLRNGARNGNGASRL